MTNFPTQWDSELTRDSKLIFSDGDPGTWEKCTVTAAIPTNTDYVWIRVNASENVYNDTSGTELDGHYADGVSFNLIIDGDITTTEDGPAVSGAFEADDVDTDDGQSTLTYTVTAQPAEGSVTNNNDGTFTFDPGNDFHDLAAGQSRNATFDFTATDSHGAVSNTATVTTTVDGVNDAPSVAADNDPVTVSEGTTATNAGTFHDVDAGDNVTITADIGSITSQTSGNSGVWSWELGTSDNFTTTTVTITAQDSQGVQRTAQFDVTSTNVAPTADLTNDGPKDEGSAVTVSFSNQTDPGTDTFTYSFDWDNDGVYETVDQASSSATYTWNENGTYTVGGRIKDDDGGYNEYTTTVTVNNVAPTADLGNNGPKDEGTAVTVSFTNQSDPGTSDTFTYSFDWDNDGTYEIVDQASASAGNT